MQAKMQELEDNVNMTSSKLNASVHEMQEKIDQLANQVCHSSIEEIAVVLWL